MVTTNGYFCYSTSRHYVKYKWCSFAIETMVNPTYTDQLQGLQLQQHANTRRKVETKLTESISQGGSFTFQGNKYGECSHSG